MPLGYGCLFTVSPVRADSLKKARY
ncbi:rCG58518 [Rattus norvegicus]|uniref:RCG58518 n=1 Tax=Rattus norvegicus TaxID=10116 RepID=A6K703_RAT|nr:rCG58518 [Rattus norvegicus]